jgi:hypothetical protein
VHLLPALGLSQFPFRLRELLAGLFEPLQIALYFSAKLLRFFPETCDPSLTIR